MEEIGDVVYEVNYNVPKPNDHPELNFTDEKENIKDKLIIVEDPKQYFEKLSFNENKICENIIETPDNSFLGHSQLLDRVTSTPYFPNLIFFASKTRIHSYNRRTKELNIVYSYDSTGPYDYRCISAIKAYKNNIFIGTTNGDVTKITIQSDNQIEVVVRNTPNMKNGFCFYEYNDYEFVIVASNSTALGLETYEISTMTLMDSIATPLPEYRTCLGGIAISPSKRFFIGIGDKREIYVYEIIPTEAHCSSYKLRRTMGVTGNCHTADWAPDESCFAVTCEAGECYLFSFKEVDDELQITLQAAYNNSILAKPNSYLLNSAIEVVKFHPKTSVPIMVFAASRQMNIYVVDYTNYNIVQTFALDEELVINNGLEFSVDGSELFVHYVPTAWMAKGGKLLNFKLKEVGTLANICLEYLRKNKATLDATQLQQLLPDTLLERLSLNNN